MHRYFLIKRVVKVLFILVIMKIILTSLTSGAYDDHSFERIREEVTGNLELDDTYIADTAVEIASDYPGDYSINQICAIHDKLVEGWNYYPEKAKNDYFRNASWILRHGKGSNKLGMGDCDDFAILMASLIESLDGSARIVFAYDVVGKKAHAYAEVYLGPDGDPGVEKCLKWLKTEYFEDTFPGINITDGEVWLNLDYNSTHPGGPYFDQEKKNVIRQIVRWPEDRNQPGVLPVIDSMDSPVGWNTSRDSLGSDIALSQTRGKKGNALEISYNLKRGGWVAISKDIDPEDIYQIKGLNLSYYIMDKHNTIELKLIEETGAEFTATWVPMVAAEKWASLETLFSDLRNQEQKEGNPVPKFEAGLVRRIEIVISNNPAMGNEVGNGGILMDHLRGIIGISTKSPFAEAERKRRENLAIRLVSQTENLGEDNKEVLALKTLLAAEALKMYPCWQADDALRKILALLPIPVSSAKLNFSSPYRYSPDTSWLSKADSTTRREMDIVWQRSPIVMVLSSNGSRLATASGSEIGIWEALSGKELARIKHNDYVEDMTFSPNESLLITASDDRTLMIWNATSGEKIANLTSKSSTDTLAYSQEGGFKALDLSEDGRYLLTLCGERNLESWNLSSRKLMATFTLPSQRSTSVNGKKLYCFDIASRLPVLAIGLLENKTAAVLDAVSGKTLAFLQTDDIVLALAFSPNGTELATACQDGTVCVWDTTSWQRLARESLGHSAIDRIAFSPQGDRIAATFPDGKIWLWAWRSGQGPVQMAHNDEVASLTFSQDGSKLATASYDNTARVWDAQSGQELARMEHGSAARAIAFAGRNRLVTAEDDKILHTWELTSDLEKAKLKHQSSVQAMSFSPDGSILKTVSFDRNYDVSYINGEGIPMTFSERMAEGGHDLLTGYHSEALPSDKSVCLWRLDGRNNSTCQKIGSDSWDTAFSLVGLQLAAASGSTARVWDLPSEWEPVSMDHGGNVRTLALSPDGKILATAINCTVYLWNISSREKQFELNHNGSVESLAFSPDGSRIAAGGSDNVAQVWSVSSGKEILHLDHPGMLKYVAFSAEGSRLLTISQEWVSREEDLNGESGVVPSADTFAFAGYQYASSPSIGSLKAEITDSGLMEKVLVWDNHSGENLAILLQGSNLKSAELSLDGSILAIGQSNGKILIWDIDNHRERFNLIQGGVILALAFSPDRSVLATAGDDGTCCIWNLDTGLEVVRLKHDQPLLALAFSPDGSRLATGCKDGTANIWQWRPDDLIATACSRLTRSLTLEEWRQYMGEEPYQEICPCRDCRAQGG